MSSEQRNDFGRTVDALLRPRMPFPPSGVLRVADLRSPGLVDAARQAGLDVAYTYPDDQEVLDISDQSNVPAFDLLVGGMGTFDLALRFLRVRRPVAFVLADADGTDVDADSLAHVHGRVARLGYHVGGRGSFLVGTLWAEPFPWPQTLTAPGVLATVARDALTRGGG